MTLDTNRICVDSIPVVESVPAGVAAIQIDVDNTPEALIVPVDEATRRRPVVRLPLATIDPDAAAAH